MPNPSYIDSHKRKRLIDSLAVGSDLMTMTLRRAKRFASLSWHFVAVNRSSDGTRLAWDGVVPFIR
jgi:hypothetical protein